MEFKYGPHDVCVERNDLDRSKDEVYVQTNPYKKKIPPPPPPYIAELQNHVLERQPVAETRIANAYLMTTLQVSETLLSLFQEEDSRDKGYITRSAACRVVQKFGKEHGLDPTAQRLLFTYLGQVEPPQPGKNAPPAHSLRYARFCTELAQKMHSVDECRRHQVIPPSEVDYSAMTLPEQEDYILRAFVVADRNVDHELAHDEFVPIIQKLTDTLKLSSGLMHRLFVEADFNERKAVEYHDFVPIAAKLIATDYKVNEKTLTAKIAKAGEDLLAVVNAGALSFDVQDVETMMRRMFD